MTATLRNFCLWMADWLAPPPLLLAEKATGFAQSQVQQLMDTLVHLQARSVLLLLQNNNRCGICLISCCEVFASSTANFL